MDGLILSGPRARINNDPNWEALSKQGPNISMIEKVQPLINWLKLYQWSNCRPLQSSEQKDDVIWQE